MDKRHIHRLTVVQQLYSYTYNKKSIALSDDTKLVIKHKTKIDRLINKYADKYKIEKIARVDLSILRLAIYELKIDAKQPPKVIINEAVEIAKELGSEASPGFVNAILGKIYENKK